MTVEYLVTGIEKKKTNPLIKPNPDAWHIARLAEQLNTEKRKFIIDFIKWLGERK